MRLAIIGALVAIIVLVAGLFYLESRNRYVQLIEEDINPFAANSFISIDELASIGDRDNDGDGLKEWEESLWQTDPDLKDTDGDGTNDGEEVNLGRNPTIPGPNDILSREINRNTASEDENIPKLANEGISSDIFYEYLALKESGIEISGDVRDHFVETIIENEPLRLEHRAYSVGQLVTTVDNSGESLRRYAERMGDIIINNSPKNTRNEFIILGQALERQDEEILKELDPIIEGYNRIITESLTLTVPSTISDEHIDMINTFGVIRDLVLAMKQAFKGDFTTLAAVNEYQSSVINLINAIQRIAVIFEEKNISFEENSSGYVFLHSI